MVSKAQLLQFIVSGIMVGSIYAIIAIGFNMIFNATEVINFAQGEFVMLGGMTTVTFYQVFHLPLWFSCILSVLLVTLVGIIFERLAIHPMKHFSVLNAIIITVGASDIMRGGTMIALGRDNMSFPPFTGTGDKPFMILGSSIPQQGAWIILAALLLVFGLSLFYKHSIQGIAMRSTAWNKTAAELMGVNVKWIVMPGPISAAGTRPNVDLRIDQIITEWARSSSLITLPMRKTERDTTTSRPSAVRGPALGCPGAWWAPA
jgi:branched-chain amino acid transport system permease protein